MTSTWNPPSAGITSVRTCAEEGCFAPTAGQSKYCRIHRAESRLRFKAMLAEQDAVKAERESTFAAVWTDANAAGKLAADATVPEPMIVVGHSNPLDDSSPVTTVYEPVMEGVCGFAWVNVSPGNCPFANWLKKHGFARKAYQGGVDIWIGQYGQSYERKLAHARRMAEVIRERLHIAAYAASRLD